MRTYLLVALLAVGCGSEAPVPSTVVDSGTASSTDTGTAKVDSASTDTSTDTATPVVTDTGAPVVDSSKPVTDSSTDVGSTDGGMFGEGCNDVALKGSAVTQTSTTDPLPTFTGGSIADGTWVLSKWVAYGGKMPSPTPVSQTIVISGGTWKLVAQAGPFLVRSTGNATIAGNTLTHTPTCPAGKGETAQFTATATEFHAYDPEDSAIAYFTKL